jgi:hypothetical protein
MSSMNKENHLSKIMRSLWLGLALAVSVAPAALAEKKAEQKAADRPGGTIVNTTTVTATVDAIDYNKRKVTLKGVDGNTVTVDVGPEVKNLKQIKKGDQVVVDQVESLAIIVTAKGEVPPAAGQASRIETAKPGEKPRAVAVATETVTATVEAIDYDKRTVTLRAPTGETRSLTVGPEAKRFDEVKKGDQVTVRYTVATAIAVRKAEKAPAGK